MIREERKKHNPQSEKERKRVEERKRAREKRAKKKGYSLKNSVNVPKKSKSDKNK